MRVMKAFRSSRKQLSNEQEDELTVTGEVFSGLGDAAKYISMPGYMEQFMSKLGFSPYPGTLNLKLLSDSDLKVRKHLITAGGIGIDGFSDGKRTFGAAKCFRAKVNRETEAAVLLIERTSHDESVMEVISPVNLRYQLALNDGSRIFLTIDAKSDSTL